MNFELKKSCGKPMYLQLYEAIVNEIYTNNLHSGDKLPSRRALSEELGIAQTTIDNAYKMLQDTGYINSIPRQGYVVSFKTSGYNTDIPWETKPPEEYVFSPNGIDFTQINRGQYAKLARDILYNDGIDLFSYVEKGGEFELRGALSKYLYSFMDIKCSPWQIILGASAAYLMNSLSVLFDNNTSYITENPCDPHFYKTIISYKNKIETLPLNSGDFDTNALEKCNGNILIINSNERFPRGRALSDKEINGILDWANKSPDRYIIEDGTTAELNSAKRTIHNSDKNGKVIYIGSFMRSLSPATQTSFAVLPDNLLSLWKKKHTYYYSLIPKLEQYILAEFINKGYYVKHYKQMKKIYKEKKELCKQCFTEKLGNKITFDDNSGSTYILAKLKDINYEEFIPFARKKGLKIFSINSYIQKCNAIFPNKDNMLVLGIGDLDKTKMLKGAELMQKALDEIKK